MAEPALGSRDRALLRGNRCIVGVDEVGRGALAGPVAVCAASFDRIPVNPAVQDSKGLTPGQREAAAVWILENSRSWCILEVWPELIDRINILEATRLAMRAVVSAIAEPSAVVVVDSVDLGSANRRVFSFNRADSSFFSVAAASILAKVHRDRIMVHLVDQLGFWGLESNKGYGSKQHRSGLDLHGRSFLHRRSFRWSPVLT